MGDHTQTIFQPVRATAMGASSELTIWRIELAESAEPLHDPEATPSRETQSYFVKYAPPDMTVALTAESDGLSAIAKTATLATPACVGLFALPDETTEDESGLALVLEWLDLQPMSSGAADPDRRLGVLDLASQLAALHGHHNPTFGWHRDNRIGASLQTNAPCADWLTFFREQRLLPQLRVAAKRRLPSRMIDRGERLLADLSVLLGQHKPMPSLVHGDLWAGNAGLIMHQGRVRPVVFDPAVYYGDREVDIAMARLFGGFPPEFFDHYLAVAALPDDYSLRAEVYNLYHWLNHANLFGGDYVQRASDRIEWLLAQIG
jgi:protein-ribulosamine 3-kinase